MNTTPSKVLIVDDSALIRQLLTEILNRDPQIHVVGTASDPYMARERIKQLKPDVLTLDIEMPRMDGITFLRNLMRLHPMPVIMVSSLTEAGAQLTLQALQLGAVDFVTKPKLDIATELENYAEELTAKVKAAAASRIRGPHPSPEGISPPPALTADTVLKPQVSPVRLKTTDKIVAIGASTGGTEAIRYILERMPADAPGIVITQHIPGAFSAPFARRMDATSAMHVCQAEDNQTILPGHAYVAPGDQHLLVERNGARYVCRLSNGPPVNRHRPSVDVLFRSVAHSAGANAVGAILTGMGHDGAQGLTEMHAGGASTIAQDEETSVVWGMPGAAVKLKAADKILPLQDIPKTLMHLTR